MQTQSLKPLLDFIAQPESGGDYNVVWGGIRASDHPPRPLTQMSVAEVLAWQDGIDAKYQSEAAGAYQILEDTLRGIYIPAGVSPHDLFDGATQDRLAVALLQRRGLDNYLVGRITAEKFANSLAMEWASLPVVTGEKKGRSYYGGDGLNKVGVGVDAFLSAVRAIKRSAAPERAPRASQLQSTTQRAAGAGLVGNAITAFQVVPKLQGNVQIIAIVGFVVVALGFAWVMRERARKWALGDR